MKVGYKRFTLTASTGDQTVTGIVDENGDNIDFTGTGEPFVWGIMGIGNNDWCNSFFAATGTNGTEHMSSSNVSYKSAASNSEYSVTGQLSFYRQETFTGSNLEKMTFTLKTWGNGEITFNKTVAASAVTVVMVCGIATNAQAVHYIAPGATGSDDDAQLDWSPSDNAVMLLAGGIFNFDPTSRVDSQAAYSRAGAASVDAQFSHAGRVIHGTAQCLSHHTNSDSDALLGGEYNATIFERASFTEWITNGFRFNWATGGNWDPIVLVIDDGASGDKCRAALWTTSGSTGSETFDTGDATGNSPKLAMLQSDGDSADVLTANNSAMITYGFGNTQGQDSYRCYSQNKASPGGNSFQTFDSSSCMSIVNASNVIQDDINFTSLEADGFDVNHDSNAGAKFVGVVLFGTQGAGGTNPDNFFFASI